MLQTDTFVLNSHAGGIGSGTSPHSYYSTSPHWWCTDAADLY